MTNQINTKLLQKINGKKILIWDFDGVLCYLNYPKGKNFDIWWNGLGGVLKEFDKNIINKPIHKLVYPDENVDYIIKRYGVKAEEKINSFFLKKEMHIISHSRSNIELIEIISRLPSNIGNYIWSNNQRATIKEFLGSNNIVKKFNLIVSRGIPGYLGKPNLDGFNIIRSRNNLPLNSFLLIGDSKKTDKVVADKLGVDFFLYQ